MAIDQAERELIPMISSVSSHSVSRQPSGLFGPGMRLMGNLQFSGKALLICLVFLLPVVWSSWSLYSTKASSMAFSSKERLGVKYNREIFPLINAAQQLRRDATAMAANGVTPRRWLMYRSSSSRRKTNWRQWTANWGRSSIPAKRMPRCKKRSLMQWPQDLPPKVWMRYLRPIPPTSRRWWP
jgi:hypothetical protein